MHWSWPYDDICYKVGVHIFKHLIAKQAVSFFYSLINSESSSIKPYKYYFRFHSDTLDELNKLFMKNYSTLKFSDNPLCPLISRIECRTFWAKANPICDLVFSTLIIIHPIIMRVIIVSRAWIAIDFYFVRYLLLFNLNCILCVCKQWFTK